MEFPWCEHSKYQNISGSIISLQPTYPPHLLVNTLRPRQNGRHFADDTFKCIFLKENVRISIRISLKFVPKSPVNNIPALFQIMARHRPGNKPLSEAMMVSLLTHICVTRPQWVNETILTETASTIMKLPEFCLIFWQISNCLRIYEIAWVLSEFAEKSHFAWIFAELGENCNKVWDKITYPITNFNGFTVEIWEWVSNFISHLIMDVINWPCYDLS